MAGHAGSMPPRFVHRPARCPDDHELGPGRVKIGWVPCRCAPVAMAVACVLVVAVQAVWLRHGMETGWVDAAVDAKVVASLGGHPMLLAALVWPGEPVPAAAMAAALVLACILRRRYGQAALVPYPSPLRPPSPRSCSSPSSARLPGATPSPADTSPAWPPWPPPWQCSLARMPATVPRLLRRVLAVTAFLIAAAVAFGVIGANMHHFSDTVGGAAVGTGTVLVIGLILDLLTARHSPSQGQPQGRYRPSPGEAKDAAGDQQV